MDFKDSKTYKNINAAYDGERKASTKYRIYAGKAREEGYEQIGDVFDFTGHNEQEHAEVMLKLMNYGEVPTTIENLVDSFSGENYEWTKMYKEFGETALEEGYTDIANIFFGIAEIEKTHDERFRCYADEIENGTIFCKPERTIWVCLNCGNVYYGECAPKKCPVCGYPQGYYNNPASCTY